MKSRNSIFELYIVGPTASGKSGLAMRIAEEWNGALVCADSQTIRKYLDIGTAKPTAEDRQKVPHYMLDIIEPFADFSVAEFQKLARNSILEIKQKGQLPIIVGGSGMYVDSLYYDYSIGEQITNFSKEKLETMSVTELQAIITKNKWMMPENSQNPRHLIGLILRGGAVHNDRDTESENKFIIGILPKDDVIKERITQRVEVMFSEGFVDEVKHLLEAHGSFPDRLDAIGYPVVQRYINGEIDLDTAKAEFTRGNWQYARKQKSWFKRNPDTHWFESADDAYQYITQILEHE